MQSLSGRPPLDPLLSARDGYVVSIPAERSLPPRRVTAFIGLLVLALQSSQQRVPCYDQTAPSSESTSTQADAVGARQIFSDPARTRRCSRARRPHPSRPTSEKQLASSDRDKIQPSVMVDEGDTVLEALRHLVPDLMRGELRRHGGKLSWIASTPRPVTVILDAGTCSTLLTWAPLLADLSADYRVIAYERAGYGSSDRAPLLTLGGQVDDIVSLLRRSGDGPRILVGHSWGGLLAQLAAWEDPSMIAGLVLIDPSHEEVWADESASVTRRPITPGSANWASELSDLREELELHARELANKFGGDPKLQDRWVAAELSYLASEDQARIWFDEFPMMIDSIEEIRARRAIAAYVEAPIELVTVSKGPQDVQKVRRHAASTGSLGDVHHVVVSDSEHSLQEERPALVVDSVRTVAHRAGL